MIRADQAGRGVPTRPERLASASPRMTHRRRTRRPDRRARRAARRGAAAAALAPRACRWSPPRPPAPPSARALAGSCARALAGGASASRRRLRRRRPRRRSWSSRRARPCRGRGCPRHRLQHRDDVGVVERRLALDRRRRAHERRRIERAGRGADGVEERLRRRVEHRGRLARPAPARRPASRAAPKPSAMAMPWSASPMTPSSAAQLVPVRLHRRGDRARTSPRIAVLVDRRISRPGTWRSRRDGRASSSAPRRDACSVTEAPAISSEVH